MAGGTLGAWMPWAPHVIGGPSQQFFTSALSVMLHKGICVAMLFFYLNDVSVTVLHDYATSSSKENGFAKTIFLRAPTPFLT